MTVVLLALMRRQAAAARLLLTVTCVRLAVPQNPPAVHVVPPNSRSASEHGSLIGGLESLFDRHENMFRLHG